MPRPRSIPQVTSKDIQAAVNLGSDAVMTRIMKFLASIRNPQAIQQFRKQEAALLDRVRAQALMALDEAMCDPVRRAKIYPQSLAWIYGVLYDKMRLERGESTANVSVLSALVEQAHRPRTASGSDPGQDGPHSIANGPPRDASAEPDPEPAPTD